MPKSYKRSDVYVSWIDQSTIVQSLGGTTGAIVGASQRGPINTPTLVTDSNSLLTLFGLPNSGKYGYGVHSALCHLETSDSLYYVRVVSNDALYSSIKVLPAPTTTTHTDSSQVGDGSTTNFVSTLVNTPIDKSSYTLTADTITATDDGLGVITGTGVSGTINYSTGEVTLVFAVAPADTVVLQQSYTVTSPNTLPSAGLSQSVVNNISDAFTGDSDSLFLVYSNNPGLWSSDIRIKISSVDTINNFISLDVYELSNDGVPQLVESYSDLSLLQGSVDGNGFSVFISDVINTQSQYINVVINPNITITTQLPAVSGSNYYSLTGGVDGTKVTNSQVATGWNLFSNTDTIKVNLLINAGYVTQTDFSVQSTMSALVNSRRDCIAILDVPSTQTSMNPQTLATNWRSQTQNFNNYRCVLISSWFNVLDTLNGNIKNTLPGSGFFSQVMSNIATQLFVWNGPENPLGVAQSTFFSILGLKDDYTAGQRDLLSVSQVNYFRNVAGTGIFLDSYSTEATAKSALSDINVVWSLIEVEQSANTYLQTTKWKLNTSVTRNDVVAALSNYLDVLKAQGAFYNYKLICDTSNNTPAIIDQGILIVDLLVQPVRLAKYIQLNIIPVRTSQTL